MSIAENIAFGLKIKNKPRTYIQDKIKYALKLVNLDGFENRTVDSLSGGQQQRIAIARAIVQNHRGNIICRSQEGVNRFSVTLTVLRQKEAQ